MSKKFADFIKTQQVSKADDSIDWKKQRDEWLKYLDDFYALVESSLKPYVEKRQISISFESKQIFEEEIGSYEVKSARIKIGHSEAKLDPIGTLLVGAKGRVDLVGPRGTARFVLVDADSTGPRITVRSSVVGQDLPPEPPRKKVERWAWRRTTLPPRITYLPLTDESFQDSLLEVMNG